jgi:hypothetical protein
MHAFKEKAYILAVIRIAVLNDLKSRQKNRIDKQDRIKELKNRL